MDNIPDHCTWYQCTDSIAYKVSNKLGTVLGYNCAHHAPYKNTKYYDCEVVNVDVQTHQHHIKGGIGAMPECAICWEKADEKL